MSVFWGLPYFLCDRRGWGQKRGDATAVAPRGGQCVCVCVRGASRAEGVKISNGFQVVWCGVMEEVVRKGPGSFVAACAAVMVVADANRHAAAKTRLPAAAAAAVT